MGMNNRKHKIENEIDKTLRLLDEIELVDPGPHFYSKLQNRIRNLDRKPGFTLNDLFSPVVLRPAFLVFLVLLNIVSVSFLVKETRYQSRVRQQHIEKLASEFMTGINSSDNIFTQE
jgi:hypothetical protein